MSTPERERQKEQIVSELWGWAAHDRTGCERKAERILDLVAPPVREGAAEPSIGGAVHSLTDAIDSLTLARAELCRAAARASAPRECGYVVVVNDTFCCPEHGVALRSNGYSLECPIGDAPAPPEREALEKLADEIIWTVRDADSGARRRVIAILRAALSTGEPAAPPDTWDEAAEAARLGYIPVAAPPEREALLRDLNKLADWLENHADTALRHSDPTTKIAARSVRTAIAALSSREARYREALKRLREYLEGVVPPSKPDPTWMLSIVARALEGEPS